MFGKSTDWRKIILPEEIALIKFWADLTGARDMPQRADFVVEDIWRWLPWLHLVQPMNNGTDFKYLIFSNRYSSQQTHERTGRVVSEWPDEQKTKALSSYKAVLKHRRPLYLAIPERYDKDTQVYSRVFLPFGTGNTVEHILVMLTERKNPGEMHVPAIAIEAADINALWT